MYMEQVLISIAMLCGSPISGTGSTAIAAADVLTCQQYYIKCIDKIHVDVPVGNKLTFCVLHKKRLGGEF